MCEEGWLVRLGQEGCVRIGGIVWNTWKGGGTEEEGRRNKDFKKVGGGGGGVGLRGGCLKRGGGGLEPFFELWKTLWKIVVYQ